MAKASALHPVVAIVQARMGSTRLPGKVMADVGGKPVLAHVLERLARAKRLDRVMVATTTKSRDDVIVRLVEAARLPVFRGSEADVLARYVEAARWIKAGTVVRICGEDVFMDPALVDQLVARHLARQPDYTTNLIGRTFPEGFYLEVLSRETLERLDRCSRMPAEREHVTRYLLEHPQEFRIERIEASGARRRPEVKVSVDTAEDLERVRTLYAACAEAGRTIDQDAVIEWCDRLHLIPCHAS